MGIINNKIKFNSNNDIASYYKANTLKFYNYYKEPKDGIRIIPVSEIKEGSFYFLMYSDESNWMRYAPVFLVDWKKFDDMIITYAINFNFLPLEIRSGFFDKYITTLEEEPRFLRLTFESAYRELLRVGYEYSLMEFSAKRINKVYEIPIGMLPEFLYSGWPSNIYDPNKLYQIWYTKLAKQEERHKAIISTNVDEYFKVIADIGLEFGELSNHVKRLQRNENKFGQ